jgi:UDP-N-acetylmuramate--alanine ligase
MVGIKGTGMSALAEILTSRGARVTGSDTAEKFYTDAVLQRLGIPFSEGFRAENLPPDSQLVVHSAAYKAPDNPELAAAAGRGVPAIIYPQALGLLSRASDASGISGVHGKSTTTAMCGAILRAWGFPVTVLVGAEVPQFGGRSTLVQGERYLVAETCEYRRHFLHFHPARIVITSIEPDHLDYFRDLEDMLCAFGEFAAALPAGGTVIYGADDPGASEAVRRASIARRDLVLVPYGRSASGPFRIMNEETGSGSTRFFLEGWRQEFSLRIPGEHNVANATAALALASLLWARERGQQPLDVAAAAGALAAFRGCRRRSEIVGEAGGVLFMDDYAHHPTAIEKTLDGIRAFHPGRRLIVDFMSHTYSRTQALLPEFGGCFGSADMVILHRIYASAREQNVHGITGRDLFREVAKHHAQARYFEELDDAVPFLAVALKPGDIFLTMGAGDNWRLGRQLLQGRGGMT